MTDPGRGDADALLDHLVHPARQASGRHPAHVAPVRADGREHGRLALVEDGEQHEDVVEVGTAGVGVVVEEDVAFVDVARERLRHHAGRVRHGEDVDRVVVERLRDLPAVRGHQAAGEVVALVEHGRVRRVDHVGPHLVDHRDERLADQLELHQVLHRPPLGTNGRMRARQLIPKQSPWPLSQSLSHERWAGTSVVSGLVGASTRAPGDPAGAPLSSAARDARAEPAPVRVTVFRPTADDYAPMDRERIYRDIGPSRVIPDPPSRRAGAALRRMILDSGLRRRSPSVLRESIGSPVGVGRHGSRTMNAAAGGGRGPGPGRRPDRDPGARFPSTRPLRGE